MSCFKLTLVLWITKKHLLAVHFTEEYGKIEGVCDSLQVISQNGDQSARSCDVAATCRKRFSTKMGGGEKSGTSNEPDGSVPFVIRSP